jgi:hypothetical protein
MSFLSIGLPVSGFLISRQISSWGMPKPVIASTLPRWSAVGMNLLLISSRGLCTTTGARNGGARLDARVSLACLPLAGLRLAPFKFHLAVSKKVAALTKFPVDFRATGSVCASVVNRRNSMAKAPKTPTFSSRSNAKRAAEKAIEAGSAPSIDYGI